MKPPLISVIMSVRNSDKTIKASINSILNQSFTNFEFIIINDNSSDNTNLILKEYKKKDDRIIVLNNKEKLGLTRSLNIAAKKAKGNFLARQDDDDISHKNRFKKQIEYIKKNPTHVLIGTWFNIIINNKKIKKTFPDNDNYLKKRLYLSNPFCHASTMFSKKIFKELGGYNEKYTYSQDLDLWLRFASKGKIGLVEEILVDRYTYSDPSNNRKAWIQVFNSLLIRYYNKRLTNLSSYFFLSFFGFSYHFFITLFPNKIINTIKIFLSYIYDVIYAKKIDVLFVISDFNNIGGTEKHISLILNKLTSSTNKEFRLLILRNYSKKLSEQLNINEKYIIGPPKINKYINKLIFSHYLRAFLGGLKLFFYCIIRRNKIVHLHLPTATFVGIMFLYFFNIKIIASRRSLNNYLDNYYPIIRSLEKKLFNRCKYVIGNSKAVVSQLKKEVSNQSKIRLIISGTNQFNLKNKSEIRKKIRNKLNISQDTVILIKVANLIEYKGHSFLINSLSKMIKTSNTKWKLLILGKDFGIKKDLQQQIDRNNLNKNIIFIDNVSNPRDLLFASDINILTSFQEGFSNSIIESMSAGLANIVTNVGGNIESVQDNINGFIINDFKTSELSDKISTLIHDGELLKKFSIESRKIFLEKFTLDKCIDSYKTIYNIK